MPDAIITSTASTFGTISGTFAADQSTIVGTVAGSVVGNLSGSVGVPGPAGQQGPVGPVGPPGPPGVGGTWGSILGDITAQTDLWTQLGLKAPLASPLFTGDPRGPTPALGDNDTSLATTAFVQQELMSGTANARNLEVYVRNQTGSTLAAGAIVYINGATGNRPTVTLAQANNDANSAQTMGFTKTSIANNGFGFVVVSGEVEGLDTSALTEGVQLYLSPTTAGTWTTTKPSAPQHLVYVGIVIRAHPTQGVILVAVMNGLELEELHNVALSSEANNDLLAYESSTDLWKNKTFSALGLLTSADIAGKANSASPALTGNVTITSNSTGAALFIEQAGTGNILTLHDQAADTTFVAIDQNGKINTIASSAAGGAGLNLPHGAAPTTPVNGDIWTTTTSLQWRRNGATATVANSSLANTFTAGQKQTVSHSATNAGLNIGPVAGDPSTLVNGDVWLNSTSNDLKIRINGVSETVAEQSWVTAQSYLTTAAASTNYLSKSGNLAGLASTSTSRTNIGLGTTSSVVFGTIATTETGTYPDTTSTSVNNSTGFTHVYGTALPGFSQDIFNADKDSLGLSSSTFQQFDEFSPVYPLDYKNLIANKESITLNHVVYGAGEPPPVDYTETLTINRSDGSITAQGTATGFPAGSGDNYALSISSGLILTAYNSGSPSSMTVSNAQITFPDATVQTTAYPGTTILDGYAPLASPALSGVPTAPTATLGTNTTQIATTAFVLANGGSPTFATADQLIAASSTNTVVSPNGYRMAGLTTNIWAPNVINLSSLASGAGSNIGSGYTAMSGRLLAPSAATVGYATRGFMLHFPSNNASVGAAYNFSTESGHAVRVYAGGWGSTAAGVKMRGVFGRMSGSIPVPATLAARAYGWEWNWASRTMNIIAHNGTTLTTTAVTWNPISSRTYEITCTSNGAGTISLYVDGVLLGTSSGGPTGLNNASNLWWQLEIQNEATAGAQFDCNYQNPKVYTTNG